MRARAIREGSVGLLILLSVGLFGGLVLWLRGFNAGGGTYQATFVFENTLGMQPGTAVRYRGVPVGRVLAIRPTANAVEVTAEIIQAELPIPSDSRIEANQSGLIGETTIDITPNRALADAELVFTPTGADCDSAVIICSGDELPGQVGASYEALLRSADELAKAFADPDLLEQLKLTLASTTDLADSAIALTEELTVLSAQAQDELGPLFASAGAAADDVGAAARQFEILGQDAGAAARQFEVTGQDVSSLLAANRANITATLDNINQGSTHLLDIAATLGPVVQDGELIPNLELLVANAAAAAEDVGAITATLNTPTNLVTIQQTLDSARGVFQSAQKVLADVDDLTGDPVLRNNIRQLINGLSDLVSLTHRLDLSAQLATAYDGSPAALPPGLILTPLSPEQLVAVSHQTDPKPLLVALGDRYYRVSPTPQP